MTIAEGLEDGISPMDVLLSSEHIRGKVSERDVKRVLRAIEGTGCDLYSFSSTGNFDVSFLSNTPSIPNK